MERQSGIRKFGENEIEALRVIECLKASGLEIKDIKQFMDWVTEGPTSYEKRKALFEARKEAVEAEIARLDKMLDMVKFKCWYYDTAIRDGNEDKIRAMIPDNLPSEIQKLFNSAHS
jgi:DNA-binding transcriptional MerR regulator